MSLTRIAALAATIAALGCSSPTPETLVGSCDARTSTGAPGECLRWSGEETGDFATLCTDTIGGTFAREECPETPELIGTCFSDQLFGLYLTNYYYAPDYDLASAVADCEEAGGGAGGEFEER
jgi:hypothetical protein